MGWWWNSSSLPKQETETPPPQPLPASNPPAPSPPRQLTRDEQADAEWKQLLASLEGDLNGSNRASQQTSSSSTTTTSTTTESSADTTTSPSSSSPASIAPESLYPDTMSCRAAFDYAFFCQSFGGQFVNVYRYGELRSCSEHWDNFWLCMKTRTWSESTRKQAIRDHNRKKAIKFKTGPSSEDVWDLRMEPVQEAFSGDFAALEREMKAEEEAKQKAG
ncbi:hypothetical protein EYZ11_004392 [Aspergillus tanneri]|uniref:Early meiotic induction protein 1 n=1 Tax=Aspergillus tanneri TaxID=1220188 RepID=A0A4S3JMZ1_9EURO|nr:uncharacterized protein ATNIH1004_006193 [Aspergillus tanneri]KAA8647500.1 hypothetical protein ATNIH1004_006193 [Aspergillus tanneri]THC96118.1 hypothetical protein EYZ11_004392 [Aspergillus tanneri]